jgi:hypothetical protein
VTAIEFTKKKIQKELEKLVINSILMLNGAKTDINETYESLILKKQNL